MTSERLTYRPVSSHLLDDFHRLVQDDHVRRYLMDGVLHSREWSEKRVWESENLFERRGVGVWLAYGKHDDLVGFCGFLEVPSIHPEPQLIYALFEPFTGLGYATEMAWACVVEARRAGFETILASVDAVNEASVRVLEKVGFKRIGLQRGKLGKLLVMASTRTADVADCNDPGRRASDRTDGDDPR